MRFAELESRVNAAVAGHLGNVTALIDGASVSGIFRTPPADIYGGLLSENRITLDVASCDVFSVANSSSVMIGSASYKVIGHSELSGMITLNLELI